MVVIKKINKGDADWNIPLNENFEALGGFVGNFVSLISFWPNTNGLKIENAGYNNSPILTKTNTAPELFSISNNKIVVNKKCVLNVSLSFATNINAGWCNLEVHKNGSAWSRCNMGKSGICPGSIIDTYEVEAEDIIEIKVNSDQTGYSVLNLRGCLSVISITD